MSNSDRLQSFIGDKELKPAYDYYGAGFYEQVGSNSGILKRVQEVNDYIETCLHVFGVSELFELPGELQDEINRLAVIDLMEFMDD